MITRTVANYLGLDNSDVKKIFSDLSSKIKNNSDTFFSNDRAVERLIHDYKEHQNLIIAYDFDDTVRPSKPNNSCDIVIKLLQICSKLQFTMICFTVRSGQSDVELVKGTCKSLGINCDYINEDCIQFKEEAKDMQYTHKIFYNIFLDDRAGLESACKTLVDFLDWFFTEPINDVDSRKEGY